MLSNTTVTMMAKKLLKNTGLSVKDIAEQVGFPDPFHFSKSFKALTGISPSQYREMRHT